MYQLCWRFVNSVFPLVSRHAVGGEQDHLQGPDVWARPNPESLRSSLLYNLVMLVLNPGLGGFFQRWIGCRTGHGYISWGLLEVCREVAGQGHRLLIDRKEVGIWSRQSIFINQHLMLPFGLDVIAHLAVSLSPAMSFGSR